MVLIVFVLLILLVINNITLCLELNEKIELLNNNTLLNSWISWEGFANKPNEPPAFWKDELFVHVEGSVSPMNSSSSIIFILPTGFRPSITHYFICTTSPSEKNSLFTSRQVLVKISPSGAVQLVYDGTSSSNLLITSLSFDGIRFTYSYVDEIGESVDTSDEQFTPISSLTSSDLKLTSISGLAPPSVFKHPITGITYFRGAGRLSRTDCADPTSASCDVFFIDSTYVPIGFSSETAVFPQINYKTGSYILIYPDGDNARARLYQGVVNDVVYLDGIALLPNVVELARNQPTAQSSVSLNGFSSLAVDGITSTDFSDGSCMLTNSGDTTPALATEVPWWRVDLGKSVLIQDIIITARSDCCRNSLIGFEIRIGDSLVNNGNNNPLCSSNNFVDQGATEQFSCTMTGRYLNIARADAMYPLTMCEVQVYGPTAETSGGQVMQIISLVYSTLKGGWKVWQNGVTPRAHYTDRGLVCLAGRVQYTPFSESFNLKTIGYLDEKWRPTYRTKQSIACYVGSKAGICVLYIETNGQMYARDSSHSDFPPDSGVNNWIALDGVCFGGSVYLLSVGTSGDSVIEVQGGSGINIG